MSLKIGSVLVIVTILSPVCHAVALNPFTWGKNEADDTIIMAHVIFRHGNRTPQTSELYPLDPYLNYTYFPFGNGQLTNAGKKREYSIGKALRQRYSKKLLGNVYYPNLVEASSTDYNRTKASLLLVVASLFAPEGIETWNHFLNWQPVPYNYRPTNRDEVLIGINCPKYVQLYEEHNQKPKLQADFQQHKDTFEYISKNTGLNVTSFYEVYNLYFGISTEEEWGHKLPVWTKIVWPKTIIDLAIQEYFVQTGTTELIKLAEGYHLKKILEDTRRKIENINETHGRKLYLYSAHENNLAEMLILLGVFDAHIPTYGSYLIFEVHKVNEEYGFKIYYQNYLSKDIQLLRLPACEEFCPIDKFTNILQEYIPSDKDSCYGEL
ncbi:unnamed protein product [Phaedon cochleariae]|uniref:acid phosphatase n=1 Tax=Phaedon cochleariae TaxID=80249 RepID=A0A9P0GTM9_PHACE|nr:unnamed protein product [Phaedon cochleariae]